MFVFINSWTKKLENLNNFVVQLCTIATVSCILTSHYTKVISKVSDNDSLLRIQFSMFLVFIMDSQIKPLN